MATYPWVADQFRRGLWALLGVVKGAPEVMEPPSLDGVAAGLVERVEGVGVHHGRELGKETVAPEIAARIQLSRSLQGSDEHQGHTRGVETRSAAAEHEAIARGAGARLEARRRRVKRSERRRGRVPHD